MEYFEKGYTRVIIPNSGMKKPTPKSFNEIVYRGMSAIEILYSLYNFTSDMNEKVKKGEWIFSFQFSHERTKCDFSLFNKIEKTHEKIT